MSRREYDPHQLSRRSLLKSMGLASLLLRPAPLHGMPLVWAPAQTVPDGKEAAFSFADLRLKPHYPAQSPLADLLHLVPPGSDDYVTEKYAFEIDLFFQKWGQSLKGSSNRVAVLTAVLDPSIQTSSLLPEKAVRLRSGGGIDVTKHHFPSILAAGRERFLDELEAWLRPLSQIVVAEFQITGISIVNTSPLQVLATVRYDLVAERNDRGREERVGCWLTKWWQTDSDAWVAQRWQTTEETVAVAAAPVFIDVTTQALGGTESYRRQLLQSVDHWRSVLDGASGIDVYGNNGVAAGDFDNDGFDDLYICQPAGLPNRLYRNRGDGTFEDVTEKAGVAVLDGTACALFADFENRGLQDLLVVCGTGPLLFLNQGDGTFSLKNDAFHFKTPPQGTFTHAAIADYDRDGRLDIYFCLYSYYVGLDQYHYPVPYFDARNGPPNFLLHNDGNFTFTDRTESAGLNAENDRYSFACAWGDCDSNGLPSLYVANDFGRANLYRNNGDGAFTAISGEAQVQDVGAGMSACWSDFDSDGRPDVYSANMWSAAGQRVSQQQIFHEKAPENIRELYRRHARGNALYRNQGNGRFQNVSPQAGVEMGRWSWCSDSWDFDHDGYQDLYVANGYISAPDRSDLSSFFWRQVVGRSPEDATPAPAYERGWQALNELIRSDSSWSGYERNVLFTNNRDGTFSEVSGPAGLDFLEDSRSFALADLDHDGRLEVVLKNRNAPQLRILHNSMAEIGDSVAFRLRGKKSNRDAIGAAITLEAGALRQTKYLQAGSGFLAQHSKELFFGVGKQAPSLRATVRWPSGLSQVLEAIPVNHRVEIEEGAAEFSAKPFAAPAPAYAQAGPAPAPDLLPSVFETWLFEPLKAPEFSLPDRNGARQELRSFRGGFVLLHFWIASSPICREQLRQLNQSHSSLAGANLKLLAINLDEASDTPSAHAVAAQLALSFPVLFSTEETAGIYNIVYRYLFDRRRDLPIPASFLLDAQGLIIKLYQGPIDPLRVIDDVKSAPSSTLERSQRAIPLGGTLYQGVFQRNDFTYGVAMFQHGYLEQAAASFEQVAAAKPNDPEAYYNLGTLNLRRNDFPQARKYLDQTLKLKPNYPEAWNNLGMMSAQEGRPDEAIQNFQQSLKLRPGYTIALLNLGNVYRRQGSFDLALESLGRALSLQPDDPEIQYSLGMLYAQQNQVQQAAEYLRKAIALRPQYPEALNNLGVLFVRQRNYAQAEEQFKSCIRLVPGFDQSYINLARLYVMQGNKQKARDAVSELLRLQPQNASAEQALEMLK